MPTIDSTPAPRSLVLHSGARYYDLLAGLLTFGRERALRERLATLANLAPGERVLDIGCGTGSLAIAAKRRVGATGTVRGVDASPEMIERARRKALNKRLDISFDVARAEALPFPDASCDVVLSTLMMHHLPRAVRERFAAEIHRVLRPGGRVLVVDFEQPANKRGGLISRFHRHGHVPLRDIVDLLGDAKLRVNEIGSVGVSDLRFALAGKSQDDDKSRDALPPAERSLPPLGASRWLLAIAVAVLAVVHFLVVWRAWTVLTIGTLAFGALAASVLAHAGFLGGRSASFSRHRP